MGVAVTLVTSIIVKGKLWGLIACHHYAPRHLPFEMRASAKLITEILSSKISIIENNQENSFLLTIKSFQDKLKAVIFNERDLVTLLEELKDDLNETLQTCGFAIKRKNSLVVFGKTPSGEEIKSLMEWLIGEGHTRMFHTNCLSENYETGETLKDSCSGLVSVAIYEQEKDFLLFFRPEYIQSVNWGGNPQKIETVDENGNVKLSPRRSFSLWRETTKLKSLGWRKLELEAISQLADTIRTIVDKQEVENTILESEERFRNMANNAPVMIWVADEKGNINYFNHEWERLMGHKIENNRVDNWWNFIHPEDLTDYTDTYFNGIKNKTGFKSEYRFKRKDGKYRWIRSVATSRLDREGHFNGLIVCCLDVTDYKDNEQVLSQAKNIAEAANKAKSDFLTNMSHELRTPLNAISGTAQLLMGAKITGEQRELLGTIHLSSKSLVELINGILDFAKLEAGAVTTSFEEFYLKDLVNELKEIFFFKLQEKNLQMQFMLEDKVPAIINADRLHLKQILVNLISNSIKFTHTGGISIKVSVIKQNTLSFTVADSGIGIPANKLESIFDKFVQVENSSTRSFEGSGLGLSIVKHLVDLMGGEITVKSVLGEGSTFTFTIPLNAQAVPKEITHNVPVVDKTPLTAINKQNPPSQSAVDKGFKTLLVDDNPINLRITTKMLERLACKVDTAADGLEAVKMASESDYSLILMDCQMPKMDGFEAAKLIKKN